MFNHLRKMAILKKCWCGVSVRRGSFFSGFYTLGLYTVMVATGMFHVNLDSQSKVVMILSLLMVMFSGLCIVTSTLLLVGLCVDCRILLLPWLVSVSMTTSLDVILSFFLLSETETESMLVVLFIADLLICALNVYCILCVISHYQIMDINQGSVPSHSFQAPEFVPDRITADSDNFVSSVITTISDSSSHSSNRKLSYAKSRYIYGQTRITLEEISEKQSSVESEDLLSKEEEERSTCFEPQNPSVRPIGDPHSVHGGRKTESQSVCCEGKELGYLMVTETGEKHPLLSQQYVCVGKAHSQVNQCETIISLDKRPDNVLGHIAHLCKIPASATCPSILMSSSESDLSPVNSCKLIDSE